MKIKCSKCKIPKDESEFYNSSSPHKAKMATCKECSRERVNNNLRQKAKDREEWFRMFM